MSNTGPIFCSRCGAGDQAADSYCRSCGEWLSVRDLQDARLGGKRGAWTGVCRACAG